MSPPLFRRQANGGITADGKTYTFRIKPGVKWDTTPPRQVTAADFVREFKLLCNPVSPTGAPGYFTSTIVGMNGVLRWLREGQGNGGRDRPVRRLATAFRVWSRRTRARSSSAW